MAAMLAEVYDAFLEAGASPDKARKAAEAVAAYESRAATLKQESAAEFADMKQRLTKVDGDLSLLKWMVGANTAFVLAVLFKMLFP